MLEHVGGESAARQCGRESWEGDLNGVVMLVGEQVRECIAMIVAGASAARTWAAELRPRQAVDGEPRAATARERSGYQPARAGPRRC